LYPYPYGYGFCGYGFGLDLADLCQTREPPYTCLHANIPIPTSHPHTSLAPYAPQLTPLPSPLCLHCPASECINLWRPSTTHAVADVTPSSSSLLADDIAHLEVVLGHSWSDSTCATYGAGLLTFHVFCDKRSVPESQRAPIALIILQAFISTMAGSFSHTTILNYVYGIRAWHIHHSIPWNVQLVNLHTLLNAVRRLAPASSTRLCHEPYTVATIVSLRAHLNLSSPADTAIFTCLTTAFYGVA